MTDSTNESSPSVSNGSSGQSHDQISDRLDQLWSMNVGAAADANLAVGQKVAHYTIRAFLGSGAFGVVYLADDGIKNCPVALKLPRLEVLCNSEKRQRFSAEAELELGFDHPGIVEVYACDMDGPTPYIASAWCDGGDLGNWRNQRASQGSELPPWQDVATLMADVADAVHYAHEKGVVHRDLKPANILLCHKLDQEAEGSLGLAGFRAQVADFGLAKISDPSIADTQSSLLVGTPIYMAPEQLHRSNDNVTQLAAGDVYSLGAILFEMLTGEPPIQGETYFEVLRNIRNEQPRMRLCVSGKRIKGKAVNVFEKTRFWFGRKDWFSVAGWFAIGSQTLVTTWLILSDFFKVMFGLLTMQQYLELLPQLILIAILTSFTMILFGVFTVKRKRWAAWGGAVLAAVNLSAPVIAMFNRPVIFDEVYNAADPYFSFKIHLILLLCFFCQLMFFLCAVWPCKETGYIGR